MRSARRDTWTAYTANNMKLLDLLTSPWAIMPDKLLEIQSIYATHLKGEKIDIEAVEARLGRPLASEQQDYVIRQGGVAVLTMSGAIAPKANMFTRISGGMSADMVTEQIESMRADPRVTGVVLDIDSPGGSVFGIPAMAAAIKALSAEKPTASVSTGLMASAGYWAGSAANAVYASGETDMIGSIGVVMTHNYQPRGNVQTTEITAGKYKRIASDSKPLDVAGAEYLQAQVDEIYRVFVNTVAENRRVSADHVIDRMADGRVFIGHQALAAGLIDGFATVDTLVERMATDPSKFEQRRKAVFALGALPAGVAVASVAPAPEADEPVSRVASVEQPIVEVNMTPQELAAKFAAENPEAAALLRAEGVTAEISRVQSVRAAALPGHEALIEALAADGKTSGAEAALAVIVAERGKTAAAAAVRSADAVAPVAAAAPEVEVKPVAKSAGRVPSGFVVDESQAALDAKAKEYMAEHPGTDYLAAVKAVQLEG